MKPKSLLFSLLSIFINISIFSQNITRPNVEGPSDLKVNAFTGNLLHERTDLFIPGQGLSLEASFTYNNNQKSENYGFGNGWSFTYGISYFPLEDNSIILKQADGRKDTFQLSNNNYIAPTGIFDMFEEYQPNKYKLTTKYGMKYFFDNSTHKKLTKIEDRHGNTVNLDYQSNQLYQASDASGRILNLNWEDEQLVSIVDGNANPSRVYTYSYDAEGNLISVQNPLDQTKYYNYSLDNNLVSVIDERGIETIIVYSEVNAVTRISSCLGEMRFSFSPKLMETFVSEKAGDKDQLTTYRFDEEGNLLQKMGNCCGFNTSYEYDADKNISKVIDGNGNAYNYTYDEIGNLLTETDPDGNTTTYTYEPNFNFVKSITDKRGNTTTFTYDNKGNLIQIDRPENITEQFTYGSNGNLQMYTDGRSNITTFTYDNNGQITQASYPTGSESFAYDNIGNVLTYTDANSNTFTFTYDALDRLQSATDPLGNTQTYTYDELGNLTSLTDENSNIQQHSFDFLNRLTQVQIPVATYNYSYDEVGNLTMVQDGNQHVTTYKYDERNLRTEETDAQGYTTQYEYDGNGNLVQRVDANGKITQYTYDALDRLISKSYDGNTDTYTYDENGNLTQAANTNITINYTYDALNRLASKTMVEWGKTISYTYDAAGNRASMTDPDGGQTTYSYDAFNRLVQLQNPAGQVTQFTYDDANRLTRQDNANSTYTLYTYDDADRVLTIIHHKSDNSIIKGYTYTYDARGNRLTMNEHDEGLHTYTYDDSDRLLSVNYPDGQTENFSYDAAGNRTQSTRNSETTNYTYDSADRIIAAGNTTFVFDDNGNMTQKTDEAGTTTYTYNGENRLIQVDLPDGESVTFAYDPFGNRLVKSSSVEEKRYVLDGVNTLLELDENNQTEVRYTVLFDYDTWISLDKDGSSYQYHQDDLGSTVNLTTAEEIIAATYDYFAFGEVRNISESLINSIQYTGREKDKEINLMYLRTRYFDNHFARFTTKDKYFGKEEVPLSLNRYSYVENNPITFFDPNGEVKEHTKGKRKSTHDKHTKRRSGDPEKGDARRRQGNNAPDDNQSKSSRAKERAKKKAAEKARRKATRKAAKGALSKIPYVGLGFILYDILTAGPAEAACNIIYPLSEAMPQCENDEPEEGSQEGPQPESNGEASCTVPVGSFDPNEIQGPPGFGPERWIPKNSTLPYTILYENDPDSATAAAQIVTILQDIDPNMEPKSFRLGGFGFGPFEFDVPENITHYETRLENVVDTLGVMVDVKAGIDYSKNQLYWRFTSIDPMTGFLTTDPFAGFLPVNDSTAIGEGYVTYTIKPKANVQTFDTISAQASNIFDYNDPIETNREVNTIDADPPASEVLPVSSAPSLNNLLVSWEGTDIGAGIENYTIYVSKNGGAYTKWLENTSKTNALFKAKLDTTYCFISVAKDSVGNIQSLPTLCETPVTFTVDLLEGCSSAEQLTLSDTAIVSGNYRAPQRILSTGKISSNESVVFAAGESIQLLPGFHAKPGTNFHAIIDPCETTPNLGTIPDTLLTVFKENPKLSVSPLLQNEIQLRCIPNPVYQAATILYNLPKSGSLTLTLYDNMGTAVRQLLKRDDATKGGNSFNWDTTGLESGFYYMVLKTPYAQEATKIVLVNP